MNPSFWGYSSWDFLHQVPWLFPDEVLPIDDSIHIIKFLHAFVDILGCPTCSRDASEIQKSLKMIDSLSVTMPSGKKVLTRSTVARFIYDMHNEVNKKLGKPKFGTNWRDSLVKRENWKHHMFVFLFSVVWNYGRPITTSMNENKQQLSLQKGQLTIPIELRMKYEYFFIIALPNVLRYTELYEPYKIFQDTYDFVNTTVDRKSMFRWIYELQVRIDSIQQCGPLWEFEEVYNFLTAMEARSDCSENPLGGCQ